MALLETPGATLLTLPPLLTNHGYRSHVVSRLRDPVIKRFWTDEFEAWDPRFRKQAVAPILNKLGAWITSPPLRHILAQVQSRFTLDYVMEHERILIANLSKGGIGESNARLLANLLVIKLFLTALARASQPEQARKDFYVFIDEVGFAISDVFAHIVSEARKYRLNLILSHQHLAQLDEVNPRITDALRGNIGSIIAFQLGAEDAYTLRREFAPEFDPEDLINLDSRQVCVKLAIEGVTSRPFSARTLPLSPPDREADNSQNIIKASRERYVLPRDVIEAKIARWLSRIEARRPAARVGEKAAQKPPAWWGK